MPDRVVTNVKKYRILIDEFRTVELRPTYEETHPKAVDDNWEKPQTTTVEGWENTDSIESPRKPTIAAFLRGLADELDPPGDGKVYR